MAKWVRIENRSKAQKFRCPHCGKICHSNMHTRTRTYCDYAFCPYCGKAVEPDNVEDEA